MFCEQMDPVYNPYPDISVIVPRELCEMYVDKKKKEWIEIKVPAESTSVYSHPDWTKMLVKPKRIRKLDEEYNVVYFKGDEHIEHVLKAGKHKVVASGVLTPIEIIGRYLKYYRYQLFKNDTDVLESIENTPSIDNVMDMIAMGQNMLCYMNRLPKYLTSQLYRKTNTEQNSETNSQD